ncbi:Epidermal patterning factor-like protein [Thalictrum thalictroides]|uniref:Epidermal patterning factor-like protein n=1 Tax=Thalictrum thalictroides TaxID=46969 RepID=A0A7J6VW96_THATH|nr:Epidermal patterning factor-like protein [Thalictrum thalictroides]
MSVLRHHRRLSAITAFILFFFASISGTIVSPTRKLGFGIVSNGDKEMKRGSGGLEVLDRVSGRRLVGPGSSPPTCRFKCGRCTPCKAVHVPIQPSLSVPLEYYPEAWRCKCHNKLFMP